MSEKHGIPYVSKSWSPITGCSYTGNCASLCWARNFSKRLAGRAGYPADDPFRPTFHADKLDAPLRWRKPQRVAVCFMGDLFDAGVLEEWQDEVFCAMSDILCTRHTFLCLTKQPGRMLNFARTWETSAFSNVWLGVSITNQADADERLPLLATIASAGWNTWVSVEPLLGPVDLRTGMYAIPPEGNIRGTSVEGLGWVVIGSQSGPGIGDRDDRPRIDSLICQCKAAEVPVYVKQIAFGGKCHKSPKDWPGPLRLQEFPR